jgi:beta-glucosidase
MLSKLIIGAVNFNGWNLNDPVNTHVDVQSNHKEFVLYQASFYLDADHNSSVIRKVAAASTVLLKNTNSALPIKKPKTIAIIGNGAGAGSKGPNGYTDRGGNDGVLAEGI